MQPKIGLTFASALRAFLRQDPDIVMVGEIRDKETVEIAINASLTGHLVLSTIHTNDAAGAVTRMVDMGVEPFLLRSSVIGILAQRLVRVLCPHCKYPYPAEDFELEELGLTAGAHARARRAPRQPRRRATSRAPCARATSLETFDPTQRPTFYKAKGCDQCTNTGFIGRRGIYELLLVDDAVGPLILKKRRRAGDQARRAWSRAWTRCATTARARCSPGMTTVEEVLAATQEDVEAEPVAPRRSPRARGGGVSHGRLRVPRDPVAPAASRSTASATRTTRRSLRAALKREGVLLTSAHEERRRARAARRGSLDLGRALPPREPSATSR